MKKQNKKIGRNILFVLGVSVLLYGCNKFENRNFYADKPQSIIDQEHLDSYEELKSYVNYNNQPEFKLGAELNLTNIIGNDLLYRIVQKQFDEFSFTELFHMNYVEKDGALDLGNFQVAMMALDSPNVEISSYIGPLLWHRNQQADYLNGLIADSIIPGESGIDVIQDFENDDIGGSYPVMGDGSGDIAEDPDGKSGKTLHMSGAQTFPQFTVSLPEGRTLGDYKMVTVDFKGPGSGGLYGQGMRMGISTSLGNVALTGFDSPAGFGAPDGQWARGLINLPIADLNLTSAQKELTNFVLTIGSATGAADYLMDNISMSWEKVGQVISKTPEEKEDIFISELDRWIKAIGEAGKDVVDAWSVVYQPIDDTDPSKLRSADTGDPSIANTFYWQDYLGKDYAAQTINMIKRYGNPQAKIFFTETNLVNNPDKIQGLNDFISYTENQGAKVDGIATELALNIDADKTAIEALLENLAATGKLIKISALDIGTGNSIDQATKEQYRLQSDMYGWFIEAYYRNVPPNQRAGITFRSPLDQNSSSTWRPNEPVGIWTNTNNYFRKLAYEGIVKALESNKN